MADKDKLTFAEKLLCIQINMKANKDLYNEYGKFYYRSAESIIETFKPIAKEYKVYLLLTDDIELIGDRIYVKATATLFDIESKEGVSVSAYAREPLAKKGMDESQITGTASSYARKYALNGLFILDDNKDADTNEHRRQIDNAPEPKAEAKKKPAKKAKEEPQAEDTPEEKERKQAYADLISYCAKNGPDINFVAEQFGLSAESTTQDFKDAKLWAESLGAES